MFRTAIQQYLKTQKHSSIPIKAVLFDMDGVLFDSMPHHANSWHMIMEERGLHLSKEEAYLHEGRTGSGTINIICQRQYGRNATEKEIQEIYKAKTEAFNKLPEAEKMDGAWEVLNKVKRDGLFSMVVTGSGQATLLNRLNDNFPNIFKPELMVTAFDVKIGKPHPEPYLMALNKGNLMANEAIVVENAPLGVQAASAAGIFTVAVNTGPLEDKVLLDAGANILFPSMQAFCNAWEELLKELRATKPNS
ncbi:HAD-IA family hydrolase [Bacteroides sedimenti]